MLRVNALSCCPLETDQLEYTHDYHEASFRREYESLNDEELSTTVIDDESED